MTNSTKQLITQLNSDITDMATDNLVSDGWNETEAREAVLGSYSDFTPQNGSFHIEDIGDAEIQWDQVPE